MPRAPHRRGNTGCVDFECSEDACQRLIERGFVVDWRPQGGIRISGSEIRNIQICGNDGEWGEWIGCTNTCKAGACSTNPKKVFVTSTTYKGGDLGGLDGADAKCQALAANELKKPSMSTGAVADAAGYQSEAAFQRAFKSHMGVTPAQWRRVQQASGADLVTVPGPSPEGAPGT